MRGNVLMLLLGIIVALVISFYYFSQAREMRDGLIQSIHIRLPADQATP